MGLRWDDPKRRHVDAAASWALAALLILIVLCLTVVWVDA